MKLKVKLETTGIAPKRAHETDAGYDLYAPTGGIIPAHGSAVVNTHVCVEIPDGYFGQITHRSGMNFKSGIIVPNGTIDSPYRGEIKIKLYNLTDRPYVYGAGDRIAQMIILPYMGLDVEEVEELSDTDRASTGFGDSGK